MKIEWDAYHQRYVVVEDEVEIANFPSCHEAEQWVCEESERREAAS